MLMASPLPGHDGVVFIKSFSMDGPTAVYRCFLDDDERVDVRETDFVWPDAKRLQDALKKLPDMNSERWDLVFDVLRTSYVWMVGGATSPHPSLSLEEWVLGVYRRGEQVEGFRTLAPTPMRAFSDLSSAEAFCAAANRPGIATRMPFVVACRIADDLGRSESIVVDPVPTPRAVIPRAAYSLIPGSVVGYDMKLRRLPRGGLDEAWLGPVRQAVREHSGVAAAYAWRTVTGAGDPPVDTEVDCLGLVLIPGLGEEAYHRIRYEVRDRAVAHGMVWGTPYAVRQLTAGAKHRTDTVNVVRLKTATPR
jgi:hypothetical protein